MLCTTAFKKRYSNAYARARDWIEQFDPEQLYCISIDYASAQYANDSPRTLFLLDFAIHIIDLVGFLFGDVAKVFAAARGRDAYAVSLKFENGSVGSLNLNCGRSSSVPTEEVEITAGGGNFMTLQRSVTLLFLPPLLLHALHFLVQFYLLTGTLIDVVVEPIALVVAQNRLALIDGRGSRHGVGFLGVPVGHR